MPPLYLTAASSDAPMPEAPCMRMILAASAAVVIVGAALLLLTGDSSYGGPYDTRMSNPAYPAGGPVVLHDEGRRNSHSTTTGYKPFADLIRSDGYTLKTANGGFTAEELRGVAILVIVLPRGANPTNDSAAYSEAECAAIAEWGAAGGSLLLVADHWPYGLAVRSLARRFDIDLSGGFTEDPKYHEPQRGSSHLVFSRENGLLGEHPITRGVSRVLTFTGTSMKGPDGAALFLLLSDSATDRAPGPARVERECGKARVMTQCGDAHPAGGAAKGPA